MQAELALVVADGSAVGRYIYAGLLYGLSCVSIQNNSAYGVKLLLSKDET